MNFLNKILNLIAPYDCLGCRAEGDLICQDCWPHLFTTVSREHTKSTPIEYSAATAYNGFAKLLVHAMKIDCQRPACLLIAKAMHERLPQMPRDYIVTSVPTAPARIRERGFDHTHLIAHEFARLRGLKYERLLVRHGRAKQAGASKAQRTQQIQGVYQIHPSYSGRRPIVVVDDVITTGATINEIFKLLHQTDAVAFRAIVFAKV